MVMVNESAASLSFFLEFLPTLSLWKTACLVHFLCSHLFLTVPQVSTTHFCSVTRYGCCRSQLSGKVLSQNYSGFLFSCPEATDDGRDMCMFLFFRVRAGWHVKFLTLQFNPNAMNHKVNANQGLHIPEGLCK